MTLITFSRRLVSTVSIAGHMAASAAFAGQDATVALRAKLADPGGGMIVIAHRGCHNPSPHHGLSSEPENSLAALDHCVQLGVDMMETDVKRTRDGHLVMIHDETVDRTTDGAGRVGDLTLAQIKALRLRDNEGGPGAALTDQTVPTLDEMLVHARGRILLNLDVKDPIYAEVIAAAERLGLADFVVVKTLAGPGSPPLSATEPFIRAPFAPVLAPAEPGADLGALIQAQASGIRRPIGFETARMDGRDLPALVTAVRRVGGRVWVNTLGSGFVTGYGGDTDALRHEDAVWGRLERDGVSMIQTDEPEALLMHLRQTQGLRSSHESSNVDDKGR